MAGRTTLGSDSCRLLPRIIRLRAVIFANNMTIESSVTGSAEDGFLGKPPRSVSIVAYTERGAY
jgi:hypothetical protein